MTDTEIVATDDGYYIRKSEHPVAHGGFTTFEVFENKEDGNPLRTWKTGEPRNSIAVDVYHPRVKHGETARSEVSWPSTSDKRPELARALAHALQLAADEADRLDEQSYLAGELEKP